MDNGTTFGSLESISSNLGKSVDPEIAVSQDKMYIVWTDETTGNGDIYFKTSLDKGITFSSVENLSNNTGSSVSPKSLFLEIMYMLYGPIILQEMATFI